MTRRWQTNVQDRLSPKYLAVLEGLKHDTPCEHLKPLHDDSTKRERRHERSAEFKCGSGRL